MFDSVLTAPLVIMGNKCIKSQAECAFLVSSNSFKFSDSLQI